LVIKSSCAGCSLAKLVGQIDHAPMNTARWKLVGGAVHNQHDYEATSDRTAAIVPPTSDIAVS
jgi:hypothetical protein